MAEGSDLTALLGSGVYLLSYHGTVVYVGQSRKLIQRLYAHEYAWRAKRRQKQGPAWLRQYKGFQFDAVHVIPCPIPSLDALERELIRKYEPKNNTMHLPREKTLVTLQIGKLSLTLGAMPPPPRRAPDYIPRRAVL